MSRAPWAADWAASVSWPVSHLESAAALTPFRYDAGLRTLAAGSVQEAHDFVLVAHVATLRSRVPFLH